MPDVPWGEIKDPVLGYVYISEREKRVIDSFPVQRLRRLRQLAGSEYVYPGANHTRFEHSIGVMHLAGKVIENSNLSKLMSEEEAEMVKIAALLHDVGHGPFSHIFENLLLGIKKTHEDLTKWLIENSELNDVLTGFGQVPREIGKLAIGILHKPSKAFLDQIISSGIDVDKMDFIVRDTYHTGADYGYIDVFRLIHAFDVLKENLAVDLGALSALESFIIARVESFRSIYFHRVGRAAQIMLSMAMEKANKQLGLTNFETPEEYMAMDDYTVWAMLRNCEESKPIIRDLENRKMLKCAYEKTFYERDTLISNLFSRETNRRQLQEEIARKAKVETDRIVIDVPTVPSVPYYHSALPEPMEIPVFYKTLEGEKIPQRLSQISRIYEVLRGFINILRIYTNEKNREEVRNAAEQVLGEIPASAKISY